MVNITLKDFGTILKRDWPLILLVCVLVIPATWIVFASINKLQIDAYKTQIEALQSQLDALRTENNTLKTEMGNNQQQYLACRQLTSQSTLTNALQNALLTGDVPFEWQWAGENWYGRVTLGMRNGQNVVTQARVGQIEKLTQPNTPDVVRMNGKILELLNGSFEIKDPSTIAIHMLVDKINRRTNQSEQVAIDGTLRQVSCYSGIVTYTTGDGSFEGDVNLLGHLSASVGNVVNDWFRETNPSWVSYDK